MSNETQYTWPVNPKDYERIKPPASLSAFDPRRKDYTLTALRRRFAGLRLSVIDCEYVTQTAWVRTDRDLPREPKHYPRWYALLEMDEYRKQPDPVETPMQKFVRWVRRLPRPVAEDPPRQRVFFSLSKMQVPVLREFIQEEKA